MKKTTGTSHLAFFKPTLAWSLPLALLLSSYTQAGVVTKFSSGSDLSANAAWGTGSGPAPTSGDVATWSTGSLGGSLTLGTTANSTLSWQGINITSATAAIDITGGAAGQKLSIGSGGITLASGGQNLTFNTTNAATIEANGDQTWTISGARRLTFSSGLTLTGVSDNGLSIVNNSSGTGTSSGLEISNGFNTDLSKALISGTGGLHIRGNNTIVKLNGANTYSRTTDIRPGAAGRTTKVQFNTLNNSGTASSFGSGNVELAQIASAGAVILENIGAGGSTARAVTSSNSASLISFVNNGNGAVSLNSTTSIGNLTNLTLGGSYTTSTNTLAQPITGATVTLTKNDGSSWTLNGTNTYGGTTTLNGGTLALGASGTLSSPTIITASGSTFDISASTFALAPTQTISGFGNVKGNLTVQGHLSPGNSGTPVATLNFQNDLTLDGATLDIQVSGNTDCDRLQLNGGTVSVTSPTTLSLNGVSEPGSYILITGASGTIPTSNFIITGNGSLLATLDNSSSGELILNLSYLGTNLVWNGTTGNQTWDIGISSNWTGSTNKFHDNDTVNFTDEAAEKHVTLDSIVAPSETVVSNTAGNDYIISGTGDISTGKITKFGDGNLTLNTINSYAGETWIDSGTLTLGSSGQLGNGYYTGKVQINGNLTFSSTSSQTLAGVISGTGSLTHNSTSTLTLSAVNPYNGPITVQSGTLELGSAGQLGNGSYNQPITLNGTLSLNTTATQVLSGAITGTGSLIKNQTGTLTLLGSNQITGSVDVRNGTLNFNQNFQFSSGLSVATTAGAKVLFNSGNQTIATNQTWTLGSSSSDITTQTTFGAAELIVDPAVSTLGWSIVLQSAGTGNSAVLVFNGAGKTRNLTKALISGTGTLQVRNLDTVLLGDSNTFDLPIDIRTNGKIQFKTLANSGATSSFGDGTGNLVNVSNNATTLTNTGSGGSTNRPISFSVSGTPGLTLTNDGSGATHFLGTTTLTVNGPVTLSGTYTAGTNTLAQPLAGSTTSLTKSGDSSWTLTGINTYSGNTTVNAGTLTLADNAQLRFAISATSGVSNTISGNGTLVLEGDFAIDTTLVDASALTSGSWTLENVPSLTGPYGASFTVIGFTDAGSDTWTKTVGTKIYTFNELTGTLTLSSSSNNYSNWISSYDFSAYPGADLTATGDADQDGIDNLVEHVFGTAPNAPTTGTTVLSSSSNTFTFKHPLNPSLGSDVSYTYQWSSDLEEWKSSGQTNTAGITATITPATPVANEVTVTTTLSSGSSTKLFTRLIATQATP